MSNLKILGFCVFLYCFWKRLGNAAHQQWLNALNRLGRCRGLRDAPSSVTALPLPLCSVSQLLALRESAAPLTIPGAVQGKVGPAGFAGFGNISSQPNCCSFSCTMHHSTSLALSNLISLSGMYEVAKQSRQKNKAVFLCVLSFDLKWG